MKSRGKEKIPKILQPVRDEVLNLLDMFEYFLGERQLGKPIEVLADSVRDLRILIQQLLLEHFLVIPKAKEEKFIKAMATALAKRSNRVPLETKQDKKYVDYCVGELITPFEWAEEIKREFPDDYPTQRILALDIPMLRPFDYGLRSKIRLVQPPKRKVRP